MRDMPSKEYLQEQLIRNRYNPDNGTYRGIIGVRYGGAFEDVVYFREDYATSAEIYYVEKEGEPGKWVSFLDDIANLPTLDDYEVVMKSLNDWLDEQEAKIG
jgi:hypothetical protein